jgi:hypothetical protein
MRIFLFILFTVLVASCNDYRDYKIIHLKDFEWIKEVPYEGSIIINEDTVFYYSDGYYYNNTSYRKIYRIEVLNGDFNDTIDTKKQAIDYAFNYPFEEVSTGIKFFMKSPLFSCTEQLNLIYNPTKEVENLDEKRDIIIEIYYKKNIKNNQREKLEFKLDKDEINEIYDFALYKGCYLIVVFHNYFYSKEIPNYRIGLLDLQKLIDNY